MTDFFHHDHLAICQLAIISRTAIGFETQPLPNFCFSKSGIMLVLTRKQFHGI
jgi:hypothetical protein